ncbi:MAG TPA: glycosyltransferase family 39 protein [Bellilinea sp.]|nr:glycosyltransferase family 39 protein [Bellilinea sp.]
MKTNLIYSTLVIGLKMACFRKRGKFPVGVNIKKLINFSIILWTFFVILGYYYFHKPFSLGTLYPPLRALFDVILVGAFVSLAGGIGARFLKMPSFSPLERITVQGALGLGIISLTWTGFGFLHLFTSWTAWGLLGVGMVFFRHAIWEWLKQFSAIIEIFRQTGRFKRSIAVMCLIMVLFQAVVALAPPVDWDAMTYHLQLPRLYLIADYLRPVAENPYSGHFQLAEMLYTFAMAIHRSETAALTGWAAGLLLLPGLAGVVIRFLQSAKSESGAVPAGWVAIFALLAGETFRSMLGFSATDHFSALFGCGALILMFQWLQEHQARWFYLTCLFCGFAIATKLTSIVLLVGVILCAVFISFQKKYSFLNIILGALISWLPVIPWLVKNTVNTGNPFFPYSWLSTFSNVGYATGSQLINWSGNWLERIFLPVSLTWMGYSDGGTFQTDIGPIILLLALPGILAFRRDLRIQAVAILLLPAVFVLAIGDIFAQHLMQPRLYFGVLPFLGMLAGIGWGWLQTKIIAGVRLRYFIGTAILLVGGLIIIHDSIALSGSHPFSTVVGSDTAEEYRLTNLGYYELAMRKLNELPTTSRVMMLWEPKAFYAPLSTRPDAWIQQFHDDWREFQSPIAILNHWKSQGFTHILVNQSGMEFVKRTDNSYEPEVWHDLEKTLAQLMIVETLDDVYVLYQFNDAANGLR